MRGVCASVRACAQSVVTATSAMDEGVDYNERQILDPGVH